MAGKTFESATAWEQRAQRRHRGNSSRAWYGAGRGRGEHREVAKRRRLTFTSSFEELDESSLESTLILRRMVLGNGKAGAVFATSLSLSRVVSSRYRLPVRSDGQDGPLWEMSPPLLCQVFKRRSPSFWLKT